MYNKITVGYVIQSYTDEGVCTEQEFIAGDTVEYENDMGEPISINTEKEQYQPFDMVPPMPNLIESPLNDINHGDVINVTVGVPFDALINSDFEELMDYLEQQIVGDKAILSDIIYQVITANSTTDLVYVAVEATVDMME